MSNARSQPASARTSLMSSNNARRRQRQRQRQQGASAEADGRTQKHQRNRQRATLGVLATALALTLASCTSAPKDEQDLFAIATTTQLGDVANQISQCAGGRVETLMGVGDDPHEFAVSSAQIAQMTRVPLVITNGLGLEAGMATAIANAAADGANVLEIAPLVDPIPFQPIGGTAADDHNPSAAEDHSPEAEEDHNPAAQENHGTATGTNAHTTYDPHFWHDANRMAKAARLIAAELAQATGNQAITQCGEQTAQELEALAEELHQTLAQVPQANRYLVTDHAALGYLAAAHGFTQAGVVIPGGATDAEPSSKDLAALVQTIKDTNVPAIFSNNAASQTLIESVAAEVGQIQVVQLFEGSLGPPGSGAETYQSMMRSNALLIANALTG